MRADAIYTDRNCGLAGTREYAQCRMAHTSGLWHGTCRTGCDLGSVRWEHLARDGAGAS